MNHLIPLAVGQRRFCLVPTLETIFDANHYARYLFCQSPLSFTIYFATGHQYSSQNLTFDPLTRRLRCVAGPWKYDFMFSSDFSHIQSGVVSEISSEDYWVYGLNFQDTTPFINEDMEFPGGDLIGQLEYREQTETPSSQTVNGGDVPSVCA
jgi:hypothetical protein